MTTMNTNNKQKLFLSIFVENLLNTQNIWINIR